jgi:diguanylate cyclase (GGDEF)-like protein
MKHCIRFTDTLARRGGDEFAVIMPNASDRELISIVASQLLRALAAPVYYQDHEMKISASIGIAMSFGDGIAAAALIKNADIALYKVKESGRNNFSFFETVKT